MRYRPGDVNGRRETDHGTQFHVGLPDFISDPDGNLSMQSRLPCQLVSPLLITTHGLTSLSILTLPNNPSNLSSFCRSTSCPEVYAREAFPPYGLSEKVSCADVEDMPPGVPRRLTGPLELAPLNDPGPPLPPPPAWFSRENGADLDDNDPEAWALGRSTGVDEVDKGALGVEVPVGVDDVYAVRCDVVVRLDMGYQYEDVSDSRNLAAD